MGLFKSESDVYEVLGTFFRASATDDAMGPEIRKSGLVIQFEYSDPPSIITIDAKNPPEGAYYGVYEGPVDATPDVHMTMKADVANQFWLGKLNLLTALTRRQIVAKGPIPKILKLLPAIQPAYEKYQNYLREIGRDDLLQMG
jgi:hypothetical protein